MSINGTVKRRGRPATGLGTGVNVRLQPADMAVLDGWIARQSTIISRPEAMRRLMHMADASPLLDPDGVKCHHKFGTAEPGEPTTDDYLPEHLRQRVADYLASVPFFNSESEAAADLIERGLASFEDREEVVELDANILATLQDIAGGKPLETLVSQMLDYAIRAWRARAEEADDATE